MDENNNSIYKKLIKVQSQLKAPKNQYNSFGNYKYRSCEDIVEAVKPLLEKNEATIIMYDKPILIGDRFYIESTVKFIDIESGNEIITTAQAREPETRKGMDASQVTGSSSSYARKYALNGMFCIDDTKDSDSFNNKDDNKDDKKTTNNKDTNNKSTTETEYTDAIYQVLIFNTLCKVYKNNENDVSSKLEKITSFKTKDGKEVAGVKDIKKLSSARLKCTYGKIKKEYEKYLNEVKQELKAEKAKKKQAS